MLAYHERPAGRSSVEPTRVIGRTGVDVIAPFHPFVGLQQIEVGRVIWSGFCGRSYASLRLLTQKYTRNPMNTPSSRTTTTKHAAVGLEVLLASDADRKQRRRGRSLLALRFGVNVVMYALTH